MKLRIKKEKRSAKLPKYMSEGAAGLDLFSCNTLGRCFVLRPNRTITIRTGISVAIPKGCEGQIRSRSGLAIRGIFVLNSPGTIDEDYRGEIEVILHSVAADSFVIDHHMRIAQLVICPVKRVEVEVVDDLPETSRGEGGFGSTGV